MVTIKDVAKKANVSVATVSRVVRGIGYISEETYKRVNSACDELGYIANVTAQKLKNKSVCAVGYIISDINNPYYIGIAAQLQKILSANGSELVLAFSTENPIDEEHALRYLISCHVSVILFTPTSDKNVDLLQIAQKNGIKVIQLFRKIYDDLDTVYNDDEQGCRDAVEYLAEHNKKRILLLDVNYAYIDYDKVVPSRMAGFSTDKDVKLHVAHVHLLGNNYDRIAKEICSFEPDGIIAATSVIAQEVLQFIKKENYSIEIVSFDDNRWLEVCGITALRQPIQNTSETIWQLITTESKSARTAVLKQTLICR